jgi:hypothetical protein
MCTRTLRGYGRISSVSRTNVQTCRGWRTGAPAHRRMGEWANGRGSVLRSCRLVGRKTRRADCVVITMRLIAPVLSRAVRLPSPNVSNEEKARCACICKNATPMDRGSKPARISRSLKRSRGRAEFFALPAFAASFLLAQYLKRLLDVIRAQNQKPALRPG